MVSSRLDFGRSPASSVVNPDPHLGEVLIAELTESAEKLLVGSVPSRPDFCGLGVLGGESRPDLSEVLAAEGAEFAEKLLIGQRSFPGLISAASASSAVNLDRISVKCLA